jgi:hypothetical protein
MLPHPASVPTRLQMQYRLRVNAFQGEIAAQCVDFHDQNAEFNVNLW